MQLSVLVIKVLWYSKCMYNCYVKLTYSMLDSLEVIYIQ